MQRWGYHSLRGLFSLLDGSVGSSYLQYYNCRDTNLKPLDYGMTVTVDLLTACRWDKLPSYPEV